MVNSNPSPGKYIIKVAVHSSTVKVVYSAFGSATDSRAGGPRFDTLSHTFVSPSAYLRRAVVSY